MGDIFELEDRAGNLLIDEQSFHKQVRIKVSQGSESCEIELSAKEFREMVEASNTYLVNYHGLQQTSDYQSRILDSCRKLRVDRAKEYNNGVSVDTYMAFGTKSYFTFIWTKILRLKSMISKPNNRYEGLLDSVYDGINYLLFFGAWILQQLDQGKEGDSVDICTILDEADPATRDFVAKYLESIKDGSD